MRRIFVCLLGLLMLPVFGQVAAADVEAGADAIRGASATWWVRHADTGKFYFVDVSSWSSTDADHPGGQRAYFGMIPCTVNQKGRPAKCDFHRSNYDRVKIESFSFDALMGSAHAVLRRGHSKANLTWTGKGTYSEPFLWQSVSEYMFGPSFAGIFANATLIEARRAPVEGKVFDLGLTRRDRAGSSLATYASGGASACTETFFC